LTYQGRTFPICCTGCRDEFNDHPEKYLRKASLMVPSQAGRKANRPAPARVSRFEDAFTGDVVDSPAGGPPASTGKRPPDAGATPRSQPAVKKGGGKSIAPPRSTRAASLLRIGQNLEKAGKSEAALGYFRRIVKEYPDTPAAKTAAGRIQALEKP